MGEVAGSMPKQYDAVQVHTCSPCSFNRLITVASHYCPQCRVCYCKACLCDHTVLGRSQISEWGKVPSEPAGTSQNSSTREAWNLVRRQDAAEVTCLRHPAYKVAMYCVDHEVLCCKLCSCTDHRSCSNIESLSVAAEKDGIDKTVENVKTKIENLQKNAKTLAKESKLRKKFATSSYTNFAEQLDELKEKMIAEIDKVKQEALNRKQYYIEKFDMDRAITKNILDELVKMKKSLEPADDTEQHFICIIQAKEWVGDRLKDMEKMLNATVTGTFESLTLDEEDEIIEELGKSIRSRSKMTDMRFSLETSDDEETCEVVGICQIANGNLVVADKGNKCVKELDNSYSVIGEVELDDKPSGVCVAGDTQVAVAMENKKVVLIAIGETYETVRTVDVDITSRGIGQMAHHGGKLYIFDTVKCTCGFRYYSCTCETKIQVYTDTFGLSVRSIPVKVRRCHISNSNHMLLAINKDGSRVFIAHPCGFLVSYDSLGNEIDSTDYIYAEGRFFGLWIDDQGFVNVFLKKIEHFYRPERKTLETLHVVKFSQEGLTEVKTKAASSFHENVEPRAVGFDKKLGRVVACAEKGDHIYVEKFTYKALKKAESSYY